MEEMETGAQAETSASTGTVGSGSAENQGETGPSGADLSAELEALEAKLGEAQAELERERALRRAAESEAQRVQGELSEALRRYRDALLAGADGIPGELVQGTTVAEVDDSFRRARALVERLRSQLEAAARKERVPSGAPPRKPADLSALTPQQKIALGLQRRNG